MGEVRQLFEAVDPEEATRDYVRPRRSAVDQAECFLRGVDRLLVSKAERREVADFLKRVRPPGSAAVAEWFSDSEAAKWLEVQAKAQAAFEAPLRWGWC